MIMRMTALGVSALVFESGLICALAGKASVIAKTGTITTPQKCLGKASKRIAPLMPSIDLNQLHDPQSNAVAHKRVSLFCCLPVGFAAFGFPTRTVALKFHHNSISA